MANVTSGVALSQINLTKEPSEHPEHPDAIETNPQPSSGRRHYNVTATSSAPPSLAIARVSSNPRGLPQEEKISIQQYLLEFFSQKVQVSYLILISAIIGGGLLLLVIGLAAGLGPQRTCRSAESQFVALVDKEPLTEQPTKRSVKYEPGKPWTNYRLPRSVVPVHYTIDMKPYFYAENESWFNGYVSIEANVLAATRYIIVHANEVTVKSVSIRYVPDQPKDESFYDATTPDAPVANPEVKQNFYFEHFQYFVIELTTKLKPNRTISIEMSFNGSLANSFEGFYKAPFRLPGTQQKLYAVMTQFEPLAARKAFPCFDEPNMKAYFTITLRHKPNVIALSNMNLESKETLVSASDGLTVASRFAKTSVPMSTYLVAMVIGPYGTSACRSTSFGIPVCIYVPQHLSSQTRFGLDVAVQGMEFLQTFFAFNYPLPKVDIVVYAEFRSMAMENWGLISFREEALLISNESTEGDKDIVTSVVMHELAHMWFGNLVTMDWWDDLWLNEGFASYMEFPSGWSIGRLNNGDDYTDMLRSISKDGSDSTRQIRAIDIQTGHDISAAFDSVTYQKGSSIIRMLVGAMGMDKFRAGIRQYMRKFQFKNARTSDLWQSLSQFSTMDIKSAMDTWVEQKGFPLVTVETAESGQQLILRQERFGLPQWRRNSSIIAPAATSTQLPPRWYIPVVYKDPGQVNTTTVWFPPTGMPFTIDFYQPESRPDDVKLNAEQSAYIRVNYPPSTWNKFAEKLWNNISSLGPVDRAGLVDDAMELAMAGRVPYKVVFKLVQFLARETHPIVWEAFGGHVPFLRYMLEDSPHFGLFESFILGLIRSARYRTINSRKLTPYARMVTLSMLAELSLRFRKPDEVACYSNYFRKQTWKEPRNVELRRAVFLAYLLSNDTEATFQELSNLGQQSSVKQVKRSIQYAIARTQHSWLIVKELEKVFSSEIAASDFLSVAHYSCNSPQNRQMLWNWARENYEKLKPIFGGATRNFMRWLFDIAYFFNTKTQFDEFENFVKAIGDLGAGERHKNLVLERIRLNIYWRAKSRKDAEIALVENTNFITSLIGNVTVVC